MFRLLTRDLMPQRWLWVGAGVVAAGCQAFFAACLLLRKRAPWLWPAAKVGAVALFVAWHLFFFLFRNPLDLWDKPVEDWCARWPWWKDAAPYYDKTDRVTRKYGNFFGIEQGWKMFPPPLARAGYFLDADVTFTDGSTETFTSDNELDLADHLRLGGWRQAQAGHLPHVRHAGGAERLGAPTTYRPSGPSSAGASAAGGKTTPTTRVRRRR